jgi:hypothetical protein
MLEVYCGKVYKIVPESEMVESLNDQYWQLRCEVIPEDELRVCRGIQGVQEGHAEATGMRERVIMVCHVSQVSHFTRQ